MWTALVLAACGPQVEIDDTGVATDGGTAGSADGDGTTAPPPSTTAMPCPDGECQDSGVPPDPSLPTSATMTSTSASSASDVATTREPPPPPGGACEDHFDCATLLCLELSDAPPDPEAYCENAPGGGAMRFTGTLRWIGNQAPVPGAYVVVASAISAAVNPTMVSPMAEGFTGRGGVFDFTSSKAVYAQIGLVAIADAPEYYLSATGVASPQDDGAYLPGNDVHDLWLVSAGELQLWSEELAADPVVPPSSLPLGDAGGFVGLVRDPAGAPRSGIVLASDSFESTAIVRYPSANGMQTDATSDLGLFIVLDPALAETFTVIAPDGQTTSVTSASASGAVFTAGLIL